jgi:hypothetical protein
MNANFDDPKFMGLMTLASGLLANSGWSPQRRGLGEIFGQSGMQSIAAMQQAKRQQLEMEDAAQMRAYREAQMGRINEEMLREQQGRQQMGQWQGLVGGANQQDLSAYGGPGVSMPTPMVPFQRKMEQNLLGPFAGKGEDIELQTIDVGSRGQPWDMLYAQADYLEEKSAFITDPTVQQRSQTFIKGLRDRADKLQAQDEKQSAAPTTRELEIGVIGGQPHIQPQEWDRKSRSWKNVGAPTPKFSAQSMVDVKINTGESFWKEFGKGQAEFVNKQQEKAQGAADAVPVIHNMRRNLDGGMFTGVTANVSLNFGRALSAAGFSGAKDPVANTQAFAAEAGNLVAQIIKEFGAGTGLSDADREYAQKIAAGDIKLDEGAIRKLLDIREKANRIIIQRYNKRIGQIKGKAGGEGIPFSMEVDEPPQYVKPKDNPVVPDVRSLDFQLLPEGKSLEYKDQEKEKRFQQWKKLQEPK